MDTLNSTLKTRQNQNQHHSERNSKHLRHAQWKASPCARNCTFLVQHIYSYWCPLVEIEVLKVKKSAVLMSAMPNSINYFVRYVS